MKRFVMMLAAVMVLVPASLFAQGAEVFGGFSVLSIGNTGGSRFNPLGWQAAVSGNVTERFSIVGDAGGAYKDGVKFHTFMAGPRLNHRLDRASLFGHALFGVTRASGGGSSESGFSMGYGGGVDVSAGDKLSIRVVQVDWLPVRFDGVWNKNQVRFGFGVVYKIGS
jgi:hypothetical protein